MSDNEIDKLLDDLRTLNSQLGTGDIQLDLNAQMSEFIKILFGKDESGDDKIAFLKSKSPVDRKTIDKDKFKDFIGRYQSILKGPPVESASNNTNFGSFDGTFHETQQNAGCGRHALNNLLGGTFFKSPITEDAFNKTDPYTLVELKTAIGILNTSDPLDLQKLCKCLNAIYPAKYCPSVDNGINCCQVAENYDQMVLRTALELIGFDVVPGGQGTAFGSDAKIFNSNVLDRNITGVLINPGGHWTSVRKHEGQIYYMDSIHAINESASSNKIITPAELDKILTNTVVLVVGKYIMNSGKKDFIRLKIESTAKNIVDENITITGEDEERSIKGIIYDDLTRTIDNITDVSLIDKLYESEIRIQSPYEILFGYIASIPLITDMEKQKMAQTELVDLLTTPKK